MDTSRFAYVTAGLYWCLIVCWLSILIFYWREHRRLTAISPMVGTMLFVVFVDGARTLLESVYFGTWYTARTGLIPHYLYEVLAEPQYVIAPKLINLLAALTIIGVLVRRWFPDLAADMEQQRRLQHLYNELQEAHEELKAVQEARDHLTHLIVHDMRTPLTNIITGLQTIQHLEAVPTANVKPSAELTREIVGSALIGADRLLKMVNDLLDVSRMESGEMTLNREIFPVRAVVEEAVELVDALAQAKCLTIRPEMEWADGEGGGRARVGLRQPSVGERAQPSVGVEAGLVEADREKVRRVLVNLLGNAIKYAPEGSAIVVRAAPTEGGMVRISISDSGPGIAPEHQAHIFEKFYQVPPGASSSVVSTGLGLTFCKMAVEAHGGQIGVDSAPGKGSCFWFTLPAARSAAE